MGKRNWCEPNPEIAAQDLRDENIKLEGLVTRLERAVAELKETQG